MQVWNCVSGGTCSHKSIYMPACAHKSHQCVFARVHLLGCLKAYEAFILMPPMASVETGQYLVDVTRGAAVVSSKWPTWLYGAINPERTHTTQALLFILTAKNSWNIWSTLRTWSGSSGGQIIFRLQRLFKLSSRNSEEPSRWAWNS